jgi:hypothetical protein
MRSVLTPPEWKLRLVTEAMVGIVVERPSRRELKSMSYAIPPEVWGTRVLGVKVVVNPVWCVRASTHSVWPESVLNSPPNVDMSVGSEGIGTMDEGTAPSRKYGVNAFTSARHKVLLVPSAMSAIRVARLTTKTPSPKPTGGLKIAHDPALMA